MRKALAALAMLMLAGCGTNGTSDDASRSTASPSTETAAADSTTTTTTAASTTTTAPPVDYGAQYLSMVKPSNCAGERFEAAGDKVPETANFDDPSIGPYRAAAADAAEASIQFYEALAAAQWPADLQPTVDALIEEVAAAAAWFQGIADADDNASMVAAVQAEYPAGSSASLLRAKLGLESNVGSEEDCGAEP